MLVILSQGELNMQGTEFRLYMGKCVFLIASDIAAVGNIFTYVEIPLPDNYSTLK